MNIYTTTVRMLASGRIHRDFSACNDLLSAFARHAHLVSEMNGVVRGSHTESCSHDVLHSTIYLGERPLIEVTTS